MKSTGIKNAIKVLLVVSALVFIKVVVFPTPYQKAPWWHVAGFQRFSKFDFAIYDIPKNYELITFRRDDHSRQRLLLFKERSDQKLIALAMFKGLPEVDFDQVTYNAAEPKRPFWRAAMHTLLEGDYFAIWHYFPFGWRDDFENSGKDVEIRGIKVQNKESFETAQTHVMYLEGRFNKLGFYKKSDTWRPFMTPVLDFKGERTGAVAVINDKETGKTIFAVGCNYESTGFKADEFRHMVESLTFDHIPFEDAIKAFDDYVGLGGKYDEKKINRDRLEQVGTNYIGDIIDISHLRKSGAQWKPTVELVDKSSNTKTTTTRT